MKADILSLEGKKIKSIDLPSQFSEEYRSDLINRAVLAIFSHKRQSYGAFERAGKQQSAKLSRRRHNYKTAYGIGISRVPRKVMSRRGTRFNWVGAEVSGTVGGRRAHPPQVDGMLARNKINKKEMKIALISSLSASANEKEVQRKYETLRDKKIKNLPIIVDGKITSLKTKELIQSLRKILNEMFEVALQKRSVRSGKGKMRGRKYKKTAGLLIVTGEKENMKVSGVDVKKSNNLGVIDLASGGPGRIVVYTEQAVKDLEERLNPTEKRK